MLHSLAWWMHNHALLLEALLVAASIFVALYADFIRHFVSLPPQALGTWLLKARLLTVNARLFNLCECDNNAFATVIYVARNFVVITVLTALFLGGVFLEVVAVRSEARGGGDVYSRFHANLDTSLALIFVVVVCCRLMLLGEFLYRLRNFRGYDQRLMEHVSELEQKLGISDEARTNSLSE